MQLGALLPPGAALPQSLAREREVAGLSCDSRAVKAGDLFFALSGSKTDGARFIADAVAKGAVAVVTDPRAEAPSAAGDRIVRVIDPRAALSHAAAAFFPRQPETILAVTGTSGKTSVAEFVRQILTALGRKAASLGTIGIVKPGATRYGSLTTPDPITLHRTLQELADEGITHLAMEASSHGLDQHRLDGVRLSAAAFTNLGRDHLDYHPTVDHYFDAKMRLFNDLLRGPATTAVINLDGALGDRALAVAQRASRIGKILTVGRKGSDIRLRDVRRAGFGQRIAFEVRGALFEADLPLVGEYQVENTLTALGLAISSDSVRVDEAVAALTHLEGVRGRLEIVARPNGGLVIVDYAHKPDALEVVLATLRPFARGRLICVFGCGGDRDRGKRPIMGEIAGRLADIVIVTDDNPRSEPPAAIRAAILAQAPAAREIGDRGDAIATAIGMVGEGDVLLVAGKGHEEGQIVGDKIIEFSDHAAIGRALGKKG